MGHLGKSGLEGSRYHDHLRPINTSGIPVCEPLLISELREITPPMVHQEVLTTSLQEEHARKHEFARFGYLLESMGIIPADVYTDQVDMDSDLSK